MIFSCEFLFSADCADYRKDNIRITADYLRIKLESILAGLQAMGKIFFRELDFITNSFHLHDCCGFISTGGRARSSKFKAGN